jgi:hypothetical protein
LLQILETIPDPIVEVVYPRSVEIWCYEQANKKRKKERKEN